MAQNKMIKVVWTDKMDVTKSFYKKIKLFYSIQRKGPRSSYKVFLLHCNALSISSVTWPPSFLTNPQIRMIWFEDQWKTAIADSEGVTRKKKPIVLIQIEWSLTAIKWKKKTPQKQNTHHLMSKEHVAQCGPWSWWH